MFGANTYTGNTTISVGTLGIGNANGANNNLSSGDVTIYTNGTLRVGYSVTSNGNRTYTANNITLAGGNLYAEDAWQFLTGNINVASNSIMGSTYNNAGGEQDKGLFICGVLSGSAALTVQHSGINTANASYITSFVAITNNANTYSGAITINENTTGLQGGVYLGVNGSTALANATVNVPGPVAGSSVKFGSSPLVFSSGLGGSATLGALVGSGPVVLSGYDEVNHVYTGNIALTVGGNNATTNFAGVLSGGGSLIKAGSGTYTLTGTNTYTGATTVSAGTLTIGGAGKLGGGNYSGAIVNNSSLNYDSSAAQTLSGPLSGSGTLTIASGRTLALGGLQSSSPNAVTVNDGATLNETFSSAAQLTPTSLTVGTSTGAALGFVANSTSMARLAPGTLTLNGPATINILGGNLVAGNSYPLIAYTSISGTYTLGTVPYGVAGNLSTSGNTIYFNVTGITNTVWTGVVNGTWDINTTANWTNTGTLGNKYIDGSVVQFDDTGINTTTISNSVATTLTPASVLVTNNTLNYNFKANTIIAGIGGLTKTGTANLTNSTPNTYTGPTIINKGQVVAGVASVANTSGALGNNSAVTMGNDATAVLNLNGFATQIGSLTGGGSSGGNVVLGSGTLTVGGDNSSPAAYGGVISGTGGLTKIGSGLLTVNNTNTYTGATVVSAGKLVLTGNATVPSITSGFLVGNVSGSSAAVYQSAANTTVTAQPTGGAWQLGSTAGAAGYYNLSAGTMNVTNGGEFDPGGSSGGAGTFGQFDMSGGALNIGWTNSTGASYFLPNRGGVGEVSVVNISGGTVNINSNMNESATFGGFEINWAAGGQTNTTTISGSAVFTSPSESVKLNQNNNAANVCSLNLNGGLFQILGFTAGHCASAVVNFNGGTLKAGKTANGNFLGNVASVYLYGNGGTIDNNGLAISIGQALLSPTGNGVASIAVGTAGSGYIVPPQVTIVGDGTGATAYSTIDAASGAVTGIIVTCPGTGYSTASASLAGGGGSGATAGAVTLAANTSGAMTFTGGGTTTLTGAYSSTGGLKVLAGTTLSMSTVNGVPSPAGNLTVSNATLTLDASSGTPLPANNVTVGSTLNLSLAYYANAISGTGNMTLADNTTNNLVYGVLSSAPNAAALKVSGTLTKGTNIVFNISATGLQPNWVVPLVRADSTAMTTNGFVLGSLPSGIKAVLTNDATYPNTISMLITSAGQVLSWRGVDAISVAYTNWDIGVSTNWYALPSYTSAKYQQYLANTIGDNVTFGGDGVAAADGTNYVKLDATVVPATVVFSASLPYALIGTGGISGATSVVVTNDYSSVYLATSNSYTGGTVIATSGTLVITNDNALGAAAGGVTLAGGALQLNGSITNARSFTITANSSLGVPTNASVQLNGTLSGTAGLTKTDNGTLLLAGSNNITGALIVNQGALTTLGTNVLGAVPIVGNLSGYNGVLKVAAGLFQDTFTPANIYNSSLTIGNTAGAAGDMIVSGGTVTIPKQLTIGSASYGAFSQSAGATTIGGFIALGGNANGGVLNQSGGVINLTNAPATIGYAATTTFGVMNLSGSAVFNVSGANNGVWPGEIGNGVLNVSGGAALTIASDGVSLGKGNAAASGTVNLNGGTITANFITNGVGLGTFNFNGGTLKANAAGSLIRGSTALRIYDYNGGAMIDDGGNAVTFSQPILAPVGYGVSSIALSSGGSGYIDTPIVSITGGNGSNAMATATVSGGQVTAITVTCPGSGYLNGDTLSVNFTGGGASLTPPTIGTVTFAANGTGGLTKLGAGALTLSGANTYTGLTMVTNGELFITPAHQTGAAVVVADGAKFGVSAASVSNSATIGALTLGSSGATTLDFSYGFLGNPTNAALSAGAVALNGTSTIRIAGSFALGAFPVMKYTSLSGTFNSTVSAPRGMGASVSNDTVNKIIYVNVTSLSSPIVWTGTNPLPGKTNLWDLNTTTNWLVGVDPTTYQETLPPGDAVLFNDSGTSLVLLSNTASPASLTISNSSVNYTFQGSGHISGGTGLTKTGTGTVTMSYGGNDYTGPTIVSNGTLIATGGTAIGDSSAVTLADAATASLVISNTETIGSLAGGGASGGNVALSGTLTAGGDNTSTTYAGAISGSGGLTKVGTGTMSLGGVYGAGDVSVQSGSLNLTNSGSVTSSHMYVAASSGTTGTLNISDTSTLTNNYINTGSWWINYALALGVDDGHTGNLNMSGGIINETGSVWVGAWGGTGNWTQTGGTANISSHFWVGGMQDNNTAQPNGSIGTAIISNATVSATFVAVGLGGAGAGDNPNAVAASRTRGTLTVLNGGVVNSENDLQVGRSGEGSSGWGSYGTLNIENGGIVNVASTVVRWMTVGRYNSIDATVNIKSGGTLNLNAGTDMQINEGNNTGTRVVNVQGLLQGTAAGGSYIDLNRNGTAGGTTTFNITNGGVVAVDAIVGKANCTLNFNNGTLKATADDANFIGTGFTVNILPGGAILDTAGHNPTVPGNLLNNLVDEDGGLTKNGNGTLYLNGVNTYTNVTTVNAGFLGGTGTIAGKVNVGAGAGLAPGSGGIGTLTVNNNLSLNGLSTNVFEVNGTTPANDRVAAGAAVTYGGVLSIVPSGTFTNGQQFLLFTGTGATNTGNFASIQGSPGAGKAFTFTNGVLSVVATVNLTPTNITAVVNGSNLELSWPADHLGWKLQVQTNNLATGLYTNWVTIPNTDLDNHYTNTINPVNGSVFYRMVY